MSWKCYVFRLCQILLVDNLDRSLRSQSKFLDSAAAFNRALTNPILADLKRVSFTLKLIKNSSTMSRCLLRPGRYHLIDDTYIRRKPLPSVAAFQSIELEDFVEFIFC